MEVPGNLFGGPGESQRLRSWKDERLQSYEIEGQHLHAVGLPFYWGAFFFRFRAIFLEVPGNLFGGSGESSKPLVLSSGGRARCVFYVYGGYLPVQRGAEAT